MPKSTPVPAAIANEVASAAGGMCEWCTVLGDRTPGAELHHRLPRARARNLHDAHNLVLLCGDHHRQAHAENRWPWLVSGYTLRGMYIGGDLLYPVVYNWAPPPKVLPDLDTVEMDAWMDNPDITTAEVRWAIERARRALLVT